MQLHPCQAAPTVTISLSKALPWVSPHHLTCLLPSYHPHPHGSQRERCVFSHCCLLTALQSSLSPLKWNPGSLSSSQGPRDLAPVEPLTYCSAPRSTPAQLAFWADTHAMLVPTSGTLPLLFPLPGTLPQIPARLSCSYHLGPCSNPASQTGPPDTKQQLFSFIPSPGFLYSAYP